MQNRGNLQSQPIQLLFDVDLTEPGFQDGQALEQDVLEFQYFDLGGGFDKAEQLVPEGLETRQKYDVSACQLLEQVHVCRLYCGQIRLYDVNQFFPVEIENICKASLLQSLLN